MAEPAEDDVFADDIKIPAQDDYQLAATLFLPRGAKTHAVLINSAAAVPRKIYKGFAKALAARGSVVLTYDYRGTGGSRPKHLKGFKATMSDWAALDVSGAVAWMRGRYPNQPLNYIGHSFGGQALGLIPNNSDVSRALFVASQAAYWKSMPTIERYRVFALLNLIGAPAAHIAGYVPGRFGLGEDLPKDAFLQWRGWVMSENYFFDDKKLTAKANFTNYHGPLRALCMADDPWATRAAVEKLCAALTSTQPDIITIRPADVGAAKIGHFGFFRPQMRDTLWKQSADWLLGIPAVTRGPAATPIEAPPSPTAELPATPPAEPLQTSPAEPLPTSSASESDATRPS